MKRNNDVKSKNKFLLFSQFFANLYNQLHQYYQDICEKSKDLINTNYKLGLYHFEKGNLRDALFRFKLVLKFKSDHGEAQYYLGRTLLELGRKNEAEPYLIASRSKFFPEVEYELSLIDVNKYPVGNYIPKYYILKKSNADALKNPSEQHKILCENLVKNAKNFFGSNMPLKILDLGSSFGTIGRFCKFNLNTISITGVDYNPKKIALAQQQTINEKPIYDELFADEIDEFLSKNTTIFRLIFANSVFFYNNDLYKMLSLIYKNMDNDSLLLFNINYDDNIQTFGLNNDLTELVYNKDYVYQEILKTGFELKGFTEVNLEHKKLIECACYKK